MVSKFGQAFNAAKKAGKKTFSYGGKSYNTKTAPEGPKAGPTPASRQGQDKGSGGRATSASQTKKPTAQENMKARDARQAADAKAKLNEKKPRARADYPQPAKDVGIAKAKSRIGQAAAKQANKPKK